MRRLLLLACVATITLLTGACDGDDSPPASDATQPADTVSSEDAATGHDTGPGDTSTSGGTAQTTALGLSGDYLAQVGGFALLAAAEVGALDAAGTLWSSDGTLAGTRQELTLPGTGAGEVISTLGARLLASRGQLVVVETP